MSPHSFDVCFYHLEVLGYLFNLGILKSLGKLSAHGWALLIGGVGGAPFRTGLLNLHIIDI